MRSDIFSISTIEIILRIAGKSHYTKDLLQNAIGRRVSKKKSREALNRFYNTLNYYERATFHSLFARIFRDKKIKVEDGLWTINFMGKEIKFPLKNEQMWLDWDLASAVTGHDIDIKLTYETLLKSDYCPKTFFDVGTNYGTHSLLFLSQNILTISFEPNPACIAVFDNICQLNKFEANVENTAVAENSGKAEFWFPEKDTWLGTMVSETANNLTQNYDLSKTTVEVLSLDQYVRKTGNSPDLIKIDTEGNELSVIKGAMEIIKNKKPLIIFECNKLTGNNEREKLFQIFKSLEYSIVNLPVLPSKNINAINLQDFQTNSHDNFLALPNIHPLIAEKK